MCRILSSYGVMQPKSVFTILIDEVRFFTLFRIESYNPQQVKQSPSLIPNIYSTRNLLILIFNQGSYFSSSRMLILWPLKKQVYDSPSPHPSYHSCLKLYLIVVVHSMKLTLVQDTDITLLITGNYGQANIESERERFSLSSSTG